MFKNNTHSTSWNSLADQQEDHSEDDYLEKFQFTATTKYITLTDIKNQVDSSVLHRTDFEQNLVISSFIFDEDLYVLQENDHRRDLAAELSVLSSQISKPERLSYLSELDIQEELSLLPIYYQKHKKPNDFLICQIGSGKSQQCYEIPSYGLRKAHCLLSLNKRSQQDTLNTQTIVKRALIKNSLVSSNLKNLTKQIWKLIFAFSSSKSQYAIRNLQSSTVWIHRLNGNKVEIHENFSYTINQNYYLIHASKILTSKSTKNESVSNHNSKAKKIIDQFFHNLNWSYNEPAKKTIIFEKYETLETLIEKNLKIEVILLKIIYRDCHQLYLVAASERSQEKFKFGYLQQINVYTLQQQTLMMHSKLSLLIKEGRWYLLAQQHEIWSKIPESQTIFLNPKNSYQIKVEKGAANLHLEFHNF